MVPVSECRRWNLRDCVGGKSLAPRVSQTRRSVKAHLAARSLPVFASTWTRVAVLLPVDTNDPRESGDESLVGFDANFDELTCNHALLRLHLIVSSTQDVLGVDCEIERRGPDCLPGVIHQRLTEVTRVDALVLPSSDSIRYSSPQRALSLQVLVSRLLRGPVGESVLEKEPIVSSTPRFFGELGISPDGQRMI